MAGEGGCRGVLTKGRGRGRRRGRKEILVEVMERRRRGDLEGKSENAERGELRGGWTLLGLKGGLWSG